MVIQGAPDGAAKGQATDTKKHRLKHRFEVSKKLGQGTYGKVQLAINKETGQEVAIKTIKKSKIESEQDLVRIRREIQIMSSIQHPHIIHIYEVFENKEKIVLVMQYASGGELYDYLSEKKALQDVDARRIFRQIAAAAYYCHKNKICHRDLKLENVLLDERGNAKIADFGLSNVFDERHLLGTYCGSPLYASPEIVKGTPYYGPEVDCWSMGVLLYTLVYGAMPFDGSNFKRLVKQISDGDYYEPKKKSDASGLIRRLLTVSPAKRATIIDICTDWWVNLGYEHSLLQVSEDMANLTPVRIDLLLALAPASPTPPENDESKHTWPDGQAPAAKGGESQDENGEVSSNSFAFISGGMASEMKQIRAENPDDVFHENEESDEEFLSADAAAELEGQCVKRRAEKSFDGSMVRVSSMAHKTKKPRKSDSQKKSAAALKTQMEVAEAKSEEVFFTPMSSPGDQGRSVPKCQQIVPEVVPLDATVLLETVPEVHQLVPESLPEEVTAVPETVPYVEEQKDSVVPESAISVDNNLGETPKDILVEAEQPSPLPDNSLKDVRAEPEQKPEPSKAEVKTSKSESEPTSPKKVKRKIVSSSAKKAAADKAEKDKSDKGKSECNVDKEKPVTKTSREKSPVKSSPTKEITRKPSTDSKSPVRKPSADSKPATRRPSTDAKETGRRPSIESKESPRKSSLESKELPRKLSSDALKSPKKAESPKSPEKPKIPEKSATVGSRRPGKLVMPKFLESPQGTPSPKTVESKKLVIPLRSVSDAKRAFEVKTKASPTKSSESRKASEVSPSDVKAVAASPKKHEEVQTQQSEKEVPVVDPLPAILPVEDAAPLEAQVSEAAQESIEIVQEIAPQSPASEDAEKENSVPPPEITKPVSESEEEKKIAAKSILKKTIARAKLTERKLSQQSSIESETGSNTPLVVVSPNVQTKKPNVSYFKTPKPYLKEESDSILKSEAEIILNNKPEMAPDSKLDLPKSPEDETIWGMPLGEQKLKRSALSSSIDSDMNNWRQEVEESLKRLSPEGASEDSTKINTQISTEDLDSGPSPISRSYKKFTFNKDGTCTTETGEVYTKPDTNGAWTKVERSTKVTTQPGGTKGPIEQPRPYREISPLHHSDSQSSSGSNDIFDDIFDTWTGDTVFGNLMKMNSVFGRLSKDPFHRRERRRDSVRRPKTDKRQQQTYADRRPGNLTDRDSSDNEDDFDFHFDGSDPAMPGSSNMFNFMRSMNKDFKSHLRAFKERHMPNYSRSLSRDRGDPTMHDTRGRDNGSRNGHSTMTRSVSRDRAPSPQVPVLRFVIESPKRQTSVRSEPRTYHRGESWTTGGKLSDSFEKDLYDSGVNSRDAGYTSDYASKFTSPLHSPDPFFDRTSLYGTIRPKAHQRYTKSFSPTSPSTPQSARSGPEFVDKNQLPENRRQKVETWLQMNSDGSGDSEPDPFSRTRTLLHDLPENRVFSPVNSRTYSKYNRSATDRFHDLDPLPPMGRDHRSQSSLNLDAKQRSGFRETEEASGSPPFDAYSQGRPEPAGEHGESRPAPESPLSDRPPRQSSQTRTTPHGNVTFTRSMSGNAPIRVIASPESVIEMETPSAGPGQPAMRMRVSFNRNNSGGSSVPLKEAPIQSSTEGLWNQDRWRPEECDDGLSLLEALKTRGYRNVISQRFQVDTQPKPEETSPKSPEVAEPSPQPDTPTQRGKACSYAPAETESNACCMDTNPPDTTKQEKAKRHSTSNVKRINGEEASDGTLTPDSLDKEKPGEFKPKNYEEESVSERIRRKSYFMRFNDDRPKRRTSTYRDPDYLSDYRGGLWSRFNTDDLNDDVPIVPRRTNRRNNSTLEKRSSANLDDYLDEYSTRRSDSRSSYNFDDFLSDDGLWGTYNPKPSRLTNGHTTANNETSWADRPGALWTQRSRHKSYNEPSVIDTVPDLGDRRWSSRSSFSFYSPTVTPKSPVFPHQTFSPADPGDRVQRRNSLIEADLAVSEESDAKSRASDDLNGALNGDPREIINRALEILNQCSAD